jgi:hypothetical protein
MAIFREARVPNRHTPLLAQRFAEKIDAKFVRGCYFGRMAGFIACAK